MANTKTNAKSGTKANARRSGLGKGLGALMESVDITTESHEGTTTVSIAKIKPQEGQPRIKFDEAELAELADSLTQHGILQPLLVRPVSHKGTKEESYEIIAGERRYQAAKMAGLDEVPVVIRDVDDDEAYRLALIENLQRSDLDPIEEARGYKHLSDAENLSPTNIAKIVSKSRSAVSNALRLLELPDQVQNYLVQGLITPGHARAILAVPEDENRVALAEKVVHDNLTVRQTEALAPLIASNTDVPRRRTPTPESYKRAARQLREALGSSVRVKQVRGKNKIEIEFTDEEDLGRLVSTIVRWGDR